MIITILYELYNKSISINIVVNIMETTDVNKLHNYAHYIFRGIYYNYIHSETGIAVSRCIIFILLVTFIIYAKYDYLIWFLAFIFFLEVISYSTSDSSSWLNIWSELRPVIIKSDNVNSNINLYQGDSLSKNVGGSIIDNINKITEGLSLNEKEGFLFISRGDDSGKDYHTPNNFIKEDSQDFTDKYFESKKCNNGIGSIVMAGTNQMLGGTRNVNFSSTYDYKGKVELIRNQISNSQDNERNIKVVGASETFKQYCYNYFLDCVYDPITRSKKSFNNAGPDFRGLKTEMYNGINNNIMNLDNLLSRFNQDNFNKNDVSLNNYVVGNLIKNITDINDKSDSDFGSFIEAESNKNDDMYRARRMEMYNTVYSFKQKLNELFSLWRSNAKRYNNDIMLISISDTVLQELTYMVNYLRIIKMTMDIIIKEKEMNIYEDMKRAYDTPGNKGYIPYGYKVTSSDSIIRRDVTNSVFTQNYFSSRNIYGLDINDTINLPDEQRYLYGISFFYNNILHR